MKKEKGRDRAMLPATVQPAYSKLPTSKLTNREIECLLWVSHGKTSWETGQILGLSERTVEHHLTSAAQKLAATSRVHAVATALRLGIINGLVRID